MSRDLDRIANSLKWDVICKLKKSYAKEMLAPTINSRHSWAVIFQFFGFGLAAVILTGILSLKEQFNT